MPRFARRCLIAAVCVALAVPGTRAIAQTVSAAVTAKPVLTIWATAMSSTSSDPAPAAPAAHDSAYEQLSAVNRTIARVIFEAQTGGDGGMLTLDDIAAMKQAGQGGWARLYSELYARGLVTDKTLGQAVLRYNRHVNTK